MHRANRAPENGLISLFAGAGGLDIGLESAGFRTLAATELEAAYCQTLRENKALCSLSPSEFSSWFERQLAQKCYEKLSPVERDRLKGRLASAPTNGGYLQHAEILEGDVRELGSPELIAAAHTRRGELALIAGGPPCQPFSRAGKREAMNAKDGQLFREFVRIVHDLQPRFFLFENVKGLILTKTDVLRINCRNCGVSLVAPFELRDQWPNPNAPPGPCAGCGSAKTAFRMVEERGGSLDVILGEFERIGYQCSWKVLNAADFGAPQTRERLFIVGSRDDERVIWPVPTHGELGPPTQASLFDDANNGLEPWISIGDALWAEGHPDFGVLDRARAVLWVKNVVRPHDEPVTWTLDRPCPTVGAHQAAKFALAPDGVPEAQLRRQQWHVLGRRQGDTPPVPVRHAYLSDSELLRLQTFPSHWYLYGTRMERAFQIGNAVPVVLGRAMGEAIMNLVGRPNLAEL